MNDGSHARYQYAALQRDRISYEKDSIINELLRKNHTLFSKHEASIYSSGREAAVAEIKEITDFNQFFKENKTKKDTINHTLLMLIKRIENYIAQSEQPEIQQALKDIKQSFITVLCAYDTDYGPHTTIKLKAAILNETLDEALQNLNKQLNLAETSFLDTSKIPAIRGYSP